MEMYLVLIKYEMNVPLFTTVHVMLVCSSICVRFIHAEIISGLTENSESEPSADGVEPEIEKGLDERRDLICLKDYGWV